MAFNYFRIRKAAKFVDNATFEELIRQGQLIDLREPAEFHAKHILGARNIPSTQLKLSLAALRKDKPIFLEWESEKRRLIKKSSNCTKCVVRAFLSRFFKVVFDPCELHLI